MEENEYEKLDGVGVAGNMMAGAAAGTAEHLVMYPIDSVKTRMQALKCERKLAKGIFSNVAAMMKEEGALRPMRGATVVISGAGPAHALYFSSYEHVKKHLNKRRPQFVPESAVHSSAGVIATLFHDAVMTPAEAVKQRMQMCCSKYTRWTVCARAMLREEGGRSFFRAYTTQLSMNVPFQACQFAVYEHCKKLLNPADRYDLKSHLLAGGIAGAVAAAVTNPLDVCKTLLNTQEPQLLRELNTTKIVGMPESLRTVYRVAGFTGFTKGMSARIMFQAPSTAICWATYETIKNIIALRQASNQQPYDTLVDMTSKTSHAATTGGTETSTTAACGGADKGSDKLWETITDLPPRPLHASEAWSERRAGSSPLKYSTDTIIAPIRTK